MVDITAGGEVASGQTLKENHRYLVGEDTSAQLVVLSGGASMGVQGSYAFAKGGTAATPFYDVSSADWYYEPVRYVYEKELFSGMDDRHFAPNGAMNRAMLMTVLYRMGGSPSGQLQSADVSFRDVARRGLVRPLCEVGRRPEDHRRHQPGHLCTGAAGDPPAGGGAAVQLCGELSGQADRPAGRPVRLQRFEPGQRLAREALSWAVGTGIMGSSSLATG